MGHAAVACPEAEGVLMMGGRTSPHKTLSDVWLLKRSPSWGWFLVGSMPPRHRHSAVANPEGGAVVFGGSDGCAVTNSTLLISAQGQAREMACTG